MIGKKNKPLRYILCKVDPVIKGSPSCMRAVTACKVLLDKVTDLIFGQLFHCNGSTFCAVIIENNPN